MYLENHTEFNNNQPIPAWHFARCCWPAVVGRMPWVDSRSRTKKPAWHPMDMESDLCRKKPWSFVGLIPRFMQKQSFHASLTSNIHPCSGYTSPKCLCKPSTDITRSRNCPKHSQKVGAFPSILSIQPRGVLWEWGSHFWVSLRFPSTIAPSAETIPPCVPPSPNWTGGRHLHFL